jgi:hypothetical protein
VNRSPLARGKCLERGAGPVRRTPPRAVSQKRGAENRLRRKVVVELFPERPACVRPGCVQWADDIHEPLTRARGGSIVDRENMAPLCRECHDEVTFKPESELGWAYEIGLLVHSWDAQSGEAA